LSDLKTAIKPSHQRAQYNLGIIYAEGKGVPQDYVQAHKWFNLAAAYYPASEVEQRNSAVENRKSCSGKYDTRAGRRGAEIGARVETALMATAPGARDSKPPPILV
jgi:TPR repeat protein